ncbi:putative cold shock domain family protein [Desulfosarcina cetonica]|uniref:excalibur calcium-binding domain-containing protein n=1 Tax=Desulfosarcina cetonica TaxID=90730 RepID=UPI0006D1ADA5|nr:excalibur calcium-binding domain-containing protein [Desulfosarcina cetonica]VTR66099.1 putative cold shock domain family protein [Desulfosarcina cetonica]
MEFKGTLVRWNEDRGFGFIKSDSFNKDVFIHISALKRMSRKPRIQDIIYFEISTNREGKRKAVNARIEGVSIKIDKFNHRNENSFKFKLLFIILIIFALSALFFFKAPMIKSMIKPMVSTIMETVEQISMEEELTGFSCQGKQYCSEMTSCKEAKFYLKNCPNVKIDGDHDGIPCEGQWCH